MLRVRLVPIAVGLALSLGAARARADAPAHPDLPQTGTEPARPSPLVTVATATGARHFYGYGADLLEWDGKAIVARTRLPARIVALAPRDGKTITVTLAPKSEFGFAREKVEVPVSLDGARPGRGFWSGGPFDAYLSFREARAVASGLDLEKPLDEHRRPVVLAALSAREAVDRVNPFLPLFRGQILARVGLREDAQKAFDAAADLPGAAFNDLLRVATLLEEEGAKAAADRAFDRGLSALRAAGMRPERLQSQLAHQVLLGVPRKALFEGLQTGDVERVDRIEERVFRLCPRVEGAPTAFRHVAAWMRARGRGDLAGKWELRARDASTSVTNAEPPRGFERVLPTIAGMLVVSPLVALVVGLRRGARPNDRPARAALDALAVLLPLIASLALLAWSSARFEALARRSAAPIAMLDDAAASPDVATFVERRLVASPERDALAAWAARESAAIRAGGRDEAPPPDDALILRAFDRTDVAGALRDALGNDAPSGQVFGFRHSLIASAIALVLGWGIGRRTPRAARAASRVVPGGAASLAPVGPLLGGMFLGALFALAGLHRAALGATDHARFFGLEAIATYGVVASELSWAWAIVGAYALVHLLGLRLDVAFDKP
jgi:hypothetical protein